MRREIIAKFNENNEWHTDADGNAVGITFWLFDDADAIIDGVFWADPDEDDAAGWAVVKN